MSFPTFQAAMNKLLRGNNSSNRLSKATATNYSSNVVIDLIESDSDSNGDGNNRKEEIQLFSNTPQVEKAPKKLHKMVTRTKETIFQRKRNNKSSNSGTSENHQRKRKKRNPVTSIIDLTTPPIKTDKDAFETAVMTDLKAQSDYQKAKRTQRMATATPEMAIGSNQGASDGVVWENLSRILNDPRCKDEPFGPSKEENDMLSRITEFGITPYKFEVPLGNGVSDCVGHDRNNRLCVVEAKCLFRERKQKNFKKKDKRRAKVLEQTTAYATYLSQATQSDVAAYSFDNQDGMVALESLGIFRYENIKHHNPRNNSKRRKENNESSSERTKATQFQTIQSHDPQNCRPGTRNVERSSCERKVGIPKFEPTKRSKNCESKVSAPSPGMFDDAEGDETFDSKIYDDDRLGKTIRSKSHTQKGRVSHPGKNKKGVSGYFVQWDSFNKPVFFTTKQTDKLIQNNNEYNNKKHIAKDR